MGEAMMRVVLFGALLAGLVITGGCMEDGGPAPPAMDRESALPPDAVKVLPEDDPAPPVLHAAGYAPPVPLPSPLSTAGAEDSPFITPDGKALYFFFTPDVRVPPEQQLLDGVTGLYAATNTGGAWSVPERILLQEPGKLALDGCVCVQGSTMWFCSAREGYTGVNLFTATFRNGRWTNWAYAGDRLNRELELGEVHVTPGGAEIYFHSPRAGGAGGYDIWVTRQVEGRWQEPENIRAVNTGATEGWPFVSQDGTELWFTRTYQGSPAIFCAERGEGAWGEPRLIVSQFAGEPTLDEQGNLYFVHHYFKDGTMIEADIYLARRNGGTAADDEGG